MSDTELRLLYIESPDGERFECQLPIDTRLVTIAIDFFEARGWPMTDERGRGQRAVIERVDPANPERTKRLRSEQKVADAGLENGAVLRIFPEAIENTFPEASTTAELAMELIRLVKYEFSAHLASESSRPQSNQALFRRRDFRVDPELCFIAMPFAPVDLNTVYQDHVRPTLINRCGLRVERGDDIYSTQPIVEDIWNSINRARLIVAELTGRNPNVFYEVGMCHALGKDVVMLTQSMEDVPFDLRHLRVIHYQFTPRGCTTLESVLEKTVLNILQM